MQLGNPSTALFVKDIEISKAFYTGVLGLHIEMDFGKDVIFRNAFTIWEIQPGHVIPETLGLEKVTDLSSNRFELFFETEELEKLTETLNDAGVKFLHTIHEEPWGQKTIRFFDPDNHLIEVGESMRFFICRLFREGLSVEQIYEKSHVPESEIRRYLENL